jgi:hypothetical protein
MNSKQDEPQPPAQAGQSREAGWVAGEVGVPRSSADLWDIITHGERRGGTCAEAVKRNDGVVMAGQPDINTANPPEVSTPALTVRRKPSGERHSESRVRENRLHGLMRGGKPKRTQPRACLRGRFPPTLLGVPTCHP